MPLTGTWNCVARHDISCVRLPGAIGLDYFYDHSPRDGAEGSFHQADGVGNGSEAAHRDSLPSIGKAVTMPGKIALGLMREHWAATGLGGILHCFTGNWPQAKRALDMGFMISFAGNITFPKAQQIRDAALEVPLDRILIETDSPYLAPVPHRGKRNEPVFVKETARKLGELRGLTAEQAGEQTTRNFYNFFKLAETAESKVSAG